MSIFLAIMLKYNTNDWDTMKFVKAKTFHRIFGLVLTIGSQVTQAFGIKSFFAIHRETDKGTLLLWLNVVFFFLMLFIGETVYQW